MPPRPHDPFNDAPRRPTSRATTTTTTTTHHHNTQEPYTSGGHALRANATSRNLFAPAAPSRRPPTTTTTNTQSANELVLEDSDDAGDRMSRRAAAVGAARGGGGGGGGARTRRARAATETTIEPDEDERAESARDLVVRDERGEYLHVVPSVGEHVNGAEDEQNEDDTRLSGLTREYWASGSAAGGRGSKRWDEHELERPRVEVMNRLRDTFAKKLTDEQWMYEPTDYMEELRVANHGRV